MRVILATDGSDNAKEAAWFLAHLPHVDKLELSVLFVSNVQNLHSSINEADLIKRIEAGDQERANAIFETLKEAFDGANASLELVFAIGNIGTSIIKEAESRQADLIVLGAVGHSLLERMLGSVSDFVASHARCSVLVVRPTHLEAKKTPLKICVAVDDSDPSRHAISEIGCFGWGPNTSMDVINVVTIPYVYSEFPYEFDLTEINAAMQVVLDKASDALRPLTPNVDSHVIDWNHIGDGIVQFANKNESDLIVLGDTGSGMLGRFFLGSVSRYVLRHSKCSVWIARKK